MTGGAGNRTTDRQATALPPEPQLYHSTPNICIMDRHTHLLAFSFADLTKLKINHGFNCQDISLHHLYQRHGNARGKVIQIYRYV